MDTILSKWAKTRSQRDELDKKIIKYRKLVDNYLKKNNLAKYENEDYIVKKMQQNRTFMYKKDVPLDVWKTYSVPKVIDTVLLTEKKKKTSIQPEQVEEIL